MVTRAGLSETEIKKLRRVITGARELRKRLRRFADKLLPERPGTARTILRSRLDCVLHDRISPAIQDLEDMLTEAEGEPAA